MSDIEKIRLYGNQKIRTVWVEEEDEWYFSVKDVITILTETTNAKDYISKMNDAFVANNKQNVITSFRNSKNFGTNVLTALYGLYFLYTCRLEARGRTAMGCSTRVSGTGYMLPSYIVKDGWKYDMIF